MNRRSSIDSLRKVHQPLPGASPSAQERVPGGAVVRPARLPGAPVAGRRRGELRAVPRRPAAPDAVRGQPATSTARSVVRRLGCDYARRPGEGPTSLKSGLGCFLALQIPCRQPRRRAGVLGFLVELTLGSSVRLRLQRREGLRPCLLALPAAERRTGRGPRAVTTRAGRSGHCPRRPGPRRDAALGRTRLDPVDGLPFGPC
jgi:hypothetical protein